MNFFYYYKRILQNLPKLVNSPNKSEINPKVLRGPFSAFGVLGHGPLVLHCQFYFNFSKISSVGGECD